MSFDVIQVLALFVVPRRWFIAMMVEDVNSDQREALQQMRHPLRNSMFFEDVPSFEAVKMYASSLENTKGGPSLSVFE